MMEKIIQQKLNIIKYIGTTAKHAITFLACSFLKYLTDIKAIIINNIEYITSPINLIVDSIKPAPINSVSAELFNFKGLWVKNGIVRHVNIARLFVF